MRALFTCQPASGHAHPLIPLARQLVARGHEVAVACAPSFCPAVEAFGVRAFPAGLDWLESEAERAFPALRGMSLQDQSRWFVTDIFAGATAAAMAPDLLEFGRRWHPDVVVRDYWEFGAPVAAEALGLPHATVGLGTFLPLPILQQAIGPRMAEVRRAAGLPPDPDLAALYHYLYLHFAPPSYVPVQATVPVAHALRPPIFDGRAGERPPVWLADLPARPMVYATLGTVYNKVPGIFEALLAGLRDEAITLVLTIGREQDPARFGPQPANVHIERYIPQTLLLPHCDVVISHGGYNTVMAALDHALPQLLIPLSADQFVHAERCVALGAGRQLASDALDRAALGDALRLLLEDDTYRVSARRVQREMQALPGLDRAVDLLVELARDKRPIVAAPH